MQPYRARASAFVSHAASMGYRRPLVTACWTVVCKRVLRAQNERQTRKIREFQNFFYSLLSLHLRFLRAQKRRLCARKRATMRLFIEGPCFFTRRRAWVFSGGLTGCAEHARPLGMPGSGPRGLAGDTGRHSDVVMGTWPPAAIRAQTAHPAHSQSVKAANERRWKTQINADEKEVRRTDSFGGRSTDRIVVCPVPSSLERACKVHRLLTE